MSQTIRLPHNGWRPRTYQLKLWRYLENGGTRASAVWHRRAGKDELALHWTACAAFKRIGNYWHMLPEASQARKAIWDAINPHTGIKRIDEAFPHALRATTKDQEMLIRFKNGSTWQVVGSDNYNSLVGSPPVGVVYSEWALANPLSWGYLRPILAENGGWALFIYTPRGRNHGNDLYESAKSNPAWFSQVLTVDDTGIFTPEQLAGELKEYIAEHGETMGRALFRQEYHCSFDAAIMGSIFGEWIENAENEGRIKLDIYEPKAPVHTASDLGRSDATATWLYQTFHNEIRLIDYFEDTGLDVQQWCERVYGRKLIVDDVDKQTFEVKRWSFGDALEGHEHRQAYQYGDHFLPHDGAYKLQTAKGRSFAQQAHEFGVKTFVIPATNQITGQQAARKILPICWFERDMCRKGLNALRNYRFSYNNETKVLTKDPLHDWSSHGSKAFEIIGRTAFNTVKAEEKPKPRFLHEMTANELFHPEPQGVRYHERI